MNSTICHRLRFRGREWIPLEIKSSVAFVTEANQGLGLWLAMELLARDAQNVYAGFHGTDAVRGHRIIPIKIDVTGPAPIEAAAARCQDGSLLVNNSGISRLAQSKLDPAMWSVARETFETNFYSVIATTQAFAPAHFWNGGGAVINVLSDLSWFAHPTLAAYAATKSAAWSLANALRLDLHATGTQVLALHAGSMDTDATKGSDM